MESRIAVWHPLRMQRIESLQRDDSRNPKTLAAINPNTIERQKMTEKKELSQLARQLLGNSNAVEFYTQQEFDAALAVAKAEIMTVAIQTSKQVIMIERQACADLVRDLAKDQAIGTAQVLESAAEAILNRIPSQRQ